MGGTPSSLEMTRPKRVANNGLLFKLQRTIYLRYMTRPKRVANNGLFKLQRTIYLRYNRLFRHSTKECRRCMM